MPAGSKPLTNSGHTIVPLVVDGLLDSVIMLRVVLHGYRFDRMAIGKSSPALTSYPIDGDSFQLWNNRASREPSQEGYC